MDYGAALHAEGQPEQALVAFEKAFAIAPADLEAVSACGTLLLELGRPQAAYQAMSTVRDQLLATADGAANLGIAAEACGQIVEAQACYEHALALDANHLRALNNSGLLAASQGRWAVAVDQSRRCVELLPTLPELWVNLADMLTGARNYPAAIEVLDTAISRFPQRQDLRLRRAVALAFNAEFDRADAAFAALGPQGQAMLREFLAAANTAARDAPVKKPVAMLPNTRELFAHQAFEAMQVCDWHYNDALTRVISEMLAQAEETGAQRDWRDAQFYGLALQLHEDQIGRIRALTGQAITASFKPDAAHFVPPRAPARDGRLRIGIMAQNLRDPRIANGLARQLALHDASRFAIHLYAPTPRPEARLLEPLVPHAASVTETAHMTIDEVVARMRLDQLDLFMDTTFYTPWCRPEIGLRRVAPVQICQLTWQRHHPQQSYKYNMSDHFLHPDSASPARYGVTARLPHTVWMGANDDLPEQPAARADIGVADDALVLGAFIPSVMLDPETFGIWMQVLRALPDAILLLPTYPAMARANLAREAAAAGVSAERLVFLARCSRAEMLARMALADLFVDAVRFNANHGLVDALRMGVPAVTFAGNSMASRLGGSIVRAAGLADCVYDDINAYRQAIVALGRNRDALAQMRARLAAALPTAPLFDTARRVKDWEAAWTFMIERERAGLPPVSFDVPEQA